MASGATVTPSLSEGRILFVCATRVLLFATFMTAAACIPLIQADWGLNATQAGAIVTSFTLAYAVSLFVFAWGSDVFGAKRMVIASAVSAGIFSLAFGLFARDWWSAMVLYGLAGLAQGGIYTPLIVLLADEVAPARRGNAMGWLIASTSIGYAASLGFAALGIALGGWPMAFLVTGCLPAVGAVLLILALAPAKNRIHPRHAEVKASDEILRNRRTSLLALGYTTHCWELIGMWAWIPAFLAASFALAGADQVGASVNGAYVSGVLHLVGAVAALSMGRLSDRVGRRPVLVALAAAGAALSFVIGFLVHLPPVVLVPIVLAYGFLCLGDSPVLTTAISESVRPGYLGVVLAWRGFLGFAAGALAPLAVGATFDAVTAAGGGDVWYWGLGFAVLGIGGVLALACALALKRD